MSKASKIPDLGLYSDR